MEKPASPVKRSVTIAGHESSITLEPVFWAALEQAAARRELPLNALIADIDLWRFGGGDVPLTNLSSAIRQYLYFLLREDKIYADSMSLSADAKAPPSGA